MADTFRGQVACLLDRAMECFGETVKYQPLSGSCFSLVGVYDDNFELVDPDTEQLVSTEQPTLGVHLKDFKNITPRKGDEVCRRNGEVFRVVDIREDGHGGAVLFLHETTA